MIFFEGGLFICGSSALHGVAKYLNDADVRNRPLQGNDSTTEPTPEGIRGTIARLLLLVAALAYGAGILAWFWEFATVTEQFTIPNFPGL